MPYVATPYGDSKAQSRLPLDDELHMSAWTEYATEAAARGVAPVLTEKLLQLRFPVGEGVSQSWGVPFGGAGRGRSVRSPRTGVHGSR